MTGGRNAPFVPHPVLPFRKTPSDASGVQPATVLTYYPRLITENRSREWWWRMNSLSVTLAVASDPAFTVSRSFGMVRGMSDASLMTEKKLNLPGFSRLETQASPLAGAFSYGGTYSQANWNGLGGQLDMSCFVSLFSLGSSGTFPGMNTHATWYRGNNTILPSVLVTGTISITTPGSAAGFEIGNDPAETDPFFETTGSFLTANGGGAMRFWNTEGGVAGTRVTVTIAFGSTFERRSSGVNPIWTTAGVQILPVYQFPG